MWWGGEPIWISAEKQGLLTDIMFWLGSEVAHAGVRSTRLPACRNPSTDAAFKQ